MANNSNQSRYEGFLQTSHLPLELLEDLDSIQLDTSATQKLDIQPHSKLRLGHLVEYFVDFELQNNGYGVLARNLQINNAKKITLGEIDFIVVKNSTIQHIEVVYKFYLFDPRVGESQKDHWIGPNRKDSLNQKLTKIKNQQFPILQTTECKDLLNDLGLLERNIQQKLYFKAQLFNPFSETNPSTLNNFYLTKQQLYDQFSNDKFYVPQKLDWLIEPTPNVNWSTINDLIIDIEVFHERNQSPLIWIKTKKGNLLKAFITWWNVLEPLDKTNDYSLL